MTQMQRVAALGIAVGILFTLWDKIRNQHLLATQNLLPNLFWCLLYASSINAINCLISNFALGFGRGSQRYYPPPHDIFTVTKAVIWGALLLNFIAILWAAIRSIQTDDVLTPRVLRGKLRERACLP